jgi:hypothetical protein
LKETDHLAKLLTGGSPVTTQKQTATKSRASETGKRVHGKRQNPVVPFFDVKGIAGKELL